MDKKTILTAVALTVLPSALKLGTRAALGRHAKKRLNVINNESFPATGENYRKLRQGHRQNPKVKETFEIIITPIDDPK